MLWRALKHVNQGFYIDVGAAWPEEHSVTKAFYDAGWNGVNIEPNPAFHTLLVQERPRDINLKLALTEHAGDATLEIFENTGLSTLDAGIASLHHESGRSHLTQSVTTGTLADIWEQYVPAWQPVHFVKVDVEGLEAAVLRGNDWLKHRPWVVVVESTVPMSQIESFADWQPLLLAADYGLAYADGLNRFYVAKEQEALLSAFQYPPNFFDHFRLYEHHAAELRAGESLGAAQNAQARAEQAQNQAHQAERRATDAIALALEREEQRNTSERRAIALENEMAALRNSYSWKITSPLRTVLGYFRKQPRQ